MKNLYTLLLIFFISFGFAQDKEINTTWQTEINNVFQYLEKNRVPNGILLDYGMHFTDLHAYDGNHIVDSNRVNIFAFEDVYKTLFMSRIHSSANGFVHPDTLANQWYATRKKRTVTLAGLYFKFAEFKPNAHSSNLITISNGKLYDKYVNGNWRNPYQSKTTFVIAPSIGEISGLGINVVLPTNLWLSNQQNLIQKIEIDFDDGNGYQLITLGQEKELLYQTEGVKHWKYKLTLTNNQTKLAHSEVIINEAFAEFLNEPVPNTSSARVINNLFIGTKYDEFNRPQVVYFQAEDDINNLPGYEGNAFGSITIRYSDTLKTSITNPLIVAEGIDLGHVLEPEEEFGQNDIDNFLIRVNRRFSQFRNLVGGNNPNYDIIYVDYNKGTDYIQNNAFLLQEVIRWVNANKTGNNENVVLGESMGGLVARYALKDMEDNNEDHDTRLYVSMDAPHQGANVPISLQFAARHVRKQYVRSPLLFGGVEVAIAISNIFGTDNPSPNNQLRLSERPAPRQMLINYIDRDYDLDNSTHNAWQQELAPKGYPQQTRNIAISNGAECGDLQELLPLENIVTINGKAYPKALNNVLFGNFRTQLAGIVSLRPELIIGSFIPGNNNFYFDVYAKAHPNLSSQKIYRGNLEYEKKVLWLVPINVTLTNVEKYSFNTVLRHDSFGGGQYSIDVDEPVLINQNFSRVITTENFSFIPTPSAIDEQANTEGDYLRGYSFGNTTTAFDNFITANSTPGNNEIHTNYYQRNGNWLADELDNDPEIVDCSYMCSIIDGPDSVCASGTFSVGGFAGPINWSTSNSSIATINSNGVLTRTGNGVVTITADINGQCGSRALTLEVNVGRPNIVQEGYIVTGPAYGPTPKIPIMESVSVAPNEVGSVPGYVEAEFDLGFSTSSSFNIISQTDYTIVWSYAENNNKMIVYLDMYNPNENIIFEITAQNACGTDSFRTGFYTVDEQPFTYRISPNPATDQVTIQFEENSNQSLEKSSELLNSEPKTIRIADLNGRVWKTFEMTDRQTIDISDLPAGAYQVIFQPKGGKAIRETLIVE